MTKISFIRQFVYFLVLFAPNAPKPIRPSFVNDITANVYKTLAHTDETAMHAHQPAAISELSHFCRFCSPNILNALWLPLGLIVINETHTVTPDALASVREAPSGRRPMSIRMFILGCLVCLVSACGQPERLAEVAPGATVLAFGDSVTVGVGATEGEDWPMLLAERTGWIVVNGGVSGDTAQNGRQRIAALLEDYRPSLVIIELGGNDFLRRRPHAAVKEDLRAIVTAVREAQAQPVLMAVPELSLMAVVAGRPADAALYAELAEEENIPLIDKVFSEVLGAPDLRADQIHPNAAGYARMADGIIEALRGMGLLGDGG